MCGSQAPCAFVVPKSSLFAPPDPGFRLPLAAVRPGPQRGYADCASPTVGLAVAAGAEERTRDTHDPGTPVAGQGLGSPATDLRR